MNYYLAPMMGYTDCYFRSLVENIYGNSVTTFSEMIVDKAIIHNETKTITKHFLKNNKPVNFKNNSKFERTQDLPPVSEMVYTLMMWNRNSFLKSFKKNKFAMLHGRKYYFPISKNS